MLDGKVVIVTGAGSGLGEATAKAMAAAGATVVINDLDTGDDESPLDRTADEIRAHDGTVTTSFGDVTDFSYIERLVDETLAEHDRIDGAVNYAGFLRDGMLFNMNEDEWKSVISVHLDGHFNLVHHLGKHWRQRHKAGELDDQRSFVSVSSGSARGSVGQINYSTAKAGVLGLTRTAARELERYNVRVNAMVPAALTPMMEDNVPDEVLAELPTDELNPERVAPLPVALLSDRANDITGWTFAIAGNSVFTVSDPEFGRELKMEGGWNPPGLADSLDELVGGEPRSKTSPGGLIGKLSED